MAKYNYEFKPVITDFDIDWMKIKSACMTTISKQAGSKEPNEEWKKKLLMCQHSPIKKRNYLLEMGRNSLIVFLLTL